MKTAATAAAAAAPPASADRLPQLRCPCGTHVAAGGECGSCFSTRLQLEGRGLGRWPGEAAIEDEALERLARAPAERNLEAGAPGTTRHPPAPQSAFDFTQVPVTAAPSAPRPAPTGAAQFAAPTDDAQAHEAEVDQVADEVLRRLGAPAQSTVRRAPQAAASGVAGLGGGRSMAADLRRRFESAFDWDFSGVRLHTGSGAAEATERIGARAFALGRDLVFGAKVSDPEASEHRRLLAHELAHVVQQDMGAGTAARSRFLSLSAAAPARAQAAPRVTNVVTSAAELGVGGNDITATATIAGARPALTWTINPGGVVPAGVSVIGTGRRVRIRAVQPPVGTIVGGTQLIVRAGVTGAAPVDEEDSAPVMLVQVVNAAYATAPALAGVPSLIPGVPPANTAEPNRDGIAGNTATVNAVTAPAGRPVTVRFRRSLGATVAGNVVTPGSRTGDIGLRITDTATGSRLNEAQPSAAGPAALMADMTVNAVPTRVTALTNAGAAGPYGQRNRITFASSDAQHAPLTRIVGELITGVRDDLNIGPPNAGFNPAFLLALAVPANQWTDRLIRGVATPSTVDGLPAIDVNRFVGPGVPHLPRFETVRQRFVYASWQGGGAVVSNVIGDGQHKRSLTGVPGAFRFRTDHNIGAVHAPQRNEAYQGNPLIILSNVVATPTAAGATGLAADGVATANLAVNSSVAGRTVNWAVRTGDPVITAGNPAVLPATATLQAGLRAGRFGLRAADTVFPNRRVDGAVRVVPVRVRGLRAAPANVPTGTLASNVTVNADPGGRTLNWTLDAAATAAGVVVAPAVTGPGLAMNVTVTRPGGFSGTATVTATDSVLAAQHASVRIRFR
jgi:hypothetical protein